MNDLNELIKVIAARFEAEGHQLQKIMENVLHKFKTVDDDLRMLAHRTEELQAVDNRQEKEILELKKRLSNLEAEYYLLNDVKESK